ncbi:MAG: tRNA threonylcarbamoyladenosine dehydratase [Candidatus Riflebacteria bacterium]|jgi:tRNA A37 threonylcarbamoyladenosine dehydratase|nr:tRNA threonylcarbamoyladenosine dehydratase [Candidatus Riflebacteria bacterium]
MTVRFQRNRLLIGKEAADKLKNSHVAVFGLGGVGSHVVEGLVRAGVGKLTLVDYDDITPTNINRQCIALTNTVGIAKTEEAARRIALINPLCQVITVKRFYDSDNSNEILNDTYDAVVDSIDSFNAKIDLLIECKKRKIPVFSAMGAAGKLDPTQIRVADISESTICPLARRVRKILRYFGVERGIKVVYSIEPPILPYSHTEIDPEHKDAKPGYERMIMGSISYIPAIFGFTLSGLVIQHITGFTTARQSPVAKTKK